MEEVCVKIIDGVYLGCYKTAMSKTTLNANKITHILCVGNEMEILFKDSYKFMKMEVQDTEDENILFNFEAVYNFIEEGRSKGGILVHCYGGVSRSPTIVIAYLMKKLSMRFEEAFNSVKSLKPDINPNEGFMAKLEVFEKVVNKPIENYYKCSICRKTLFDDSNIDFQHEFTPKSNFDYKRYKKSFVSSTECSSFFLNSLPFGNMNSEIGGKIMCPSKNCKNKIGDFNPKGTQCSCGSWVVPGIQISKCKVDKVPYNNKYITHTNIQTTNEVNNEDVKSSMQPKI